MRMHKFVVQDGDIDSWTGQRIIKNVVGRLTKARCKKIDEFCKSHTFTQHCGHEWDCCGCLCGQRMTWKFDKGNIIITLTQNFNY